MLIRRAAIALGPIPAILFSATLLAQNQNQAQTNQSSQKLSNEQKREITAIVTLLDGANAGQPTPNDLSLAWVRDDLLKAQGMGVERGEMPAATPVVRADDAPRRFDTKGRPKRPRPDHADPLSA